MTVRLATLLRAGASAAALSVTATAFAQTAPAAETAAVDDAGDIVVTARRIEERLQDVPIAVSAITAEQLERQSIDDLNDVAEKTVGFAFESFTGPLAQPVIRGQTNLRTTSPVQNVSTNLNGIYIQRGYFIDQGLLDLQRVEIIKGPQSALYGRNAFAGVISLITAKADVDEFSGKVSGTLGTDERREIKGGVNIPIVPGKLGVRVYAGYSEFDGTWENSHPLADAAGAFTRGNVGGYEKKAYQADLTFTPSDVLSFEAFYTRTEREIEQNPGYTMSTSGLTYAFNSLNASPTGVGAARQNRLFVGEIPTTTSNFAGETRLPGIVIDPRTYGLRGPSEIYAGKVTISPDGPFTLSYQYGHTSANIIARGSSARDPLRPTVVFGTNFGTIFDSSGTDSSFSSDSHEGKVTYDFGKVTGFVGVNFQKTDDIESNASEFAPVNSLVEPTTASLFPVGPGLPIPTTVTFRRTTFLQREEDVLSFYGYANFQASDQLSITLEGRYTKEDQEAADLIAPDVVANPLTPGGRGGTFIAPSPPRSSRNANFFTPRGTITYKFTPDNNVYASVARGYKSGGINGIAAAYNRISTVAGAPVIDQILVGSAIPTPRAGATAVAFVQTTPGTAGLSQLQQTYEAETNWTYEIGSKNKLFDGRMTLNLAAYYTDWKNLQSNAVRLQPDGTAPASFAAIVPSLIGNLGDVKIYGVEVEGNFKLTDEFRIDYGASYNRARYKAGVVSQRFGASGNCDGIVCTTVPRAGSAFNVLPIAGNQLERTPEFDALLGLNYDTEFENGWGYFARADVTYQTKQYADEANLAWVPSRAIVNASTGVNINGFNVQAWVKNLFDKKYVSNSLFLIGTGGAGSSSYVPLFGERRTMGVTGSFKF
jgi:iron complex outermembrane receptor protein